MVKLYHLVILLYVLCVPLQFYARIVDNVSELVTLKESDESLQLTSCVRNILKNYDIERLYDVEGYISLPEQYTENYRDLLTLDFEHFCNAIHQLELDAEISSKLKGLIAHDVEQQVERVRGSSADAELIAFLLGDYVTSQCIDLLAQEYSASHEDLSEEQKYRLLALPLYMCPCEQAPLVKRLVMIVLSVRDIERTHAKHDKITITSVHSGQLFMEYLLLHALAHKGFTRVVLQCIDPIYKVIHEREGEKRVPYIQELRAYVAELYYKMRMIAKENTYDFVLHDTVESFRLLCKKDFNYMSDILMTADASMDGVSVEYTKPYKGRADESLEYREGVNRVDIEYYISARINPLIIIYMPRYTKPRIYIDRTMFADHEIASFNDEITNIIEHIDKLRENNINQYRKEFIQYVVTLIKSILSTSYSREREDIIRQRYVRKHGEVTRGKEEAVERTIQKRLEQSFEDYIRRSLSITYKSDPYLVFQELAYDALKINGYAAMIGAGLLIRFDKNTRFGKNYVSPFEQEGENDMRCIPRSKEFIYLEF